MRSLAPPGECPYCDACRDQWALIIAPAIASRGSITLGELEGKVTMLDIACHRCERRGRVSLARLIEEHGADMGLPDLWKSLAGDCQHAESTAVHNRRAIYYPSFQRFSDEQKTADRRRGPSSATATSRHQGESPCTM